MADKSVTIINIVVGKYSKYCGLYVQWPVS